MARGIETKTVHKSEFINYWKKASEFKELMQDSISKRKWNGAALAAVHAGISANDAIMVCLAGVRSISKNHSDSIKLLRDRVNVKGVVEAANHLSKLIHSKNLIEYETRLFTQSEAYALVKHAERFMDWVKLILPEDKIEPK